jgi:hypothetical protein
MVYKTSKLECTQGAKTLLKRACINRAFNPNPVNFSVPTLRRQRTRLPYRMKRCEADREGARVARSNQDLTMVFFITDYSSDKTGHLMARVWRECDVNMARLWRVYDGSMMAANPPRG